jgi:hypothetical protein
MLDKFNSATQLNNPEAKFTLSQIHAMCQVKLEKCETVHKKDDKKTSEEFLNRFLKGLIRNKKEESDETYAGGSNKHWQEKRNALRDARKRFVFFIYNLYLRQKKNITNDEPTTFKEWEKLYPPVQKMKPFKFKGKVDINIDDRMDLDFKQLYTYIDVQNMVYESTLNSIQKTTIKVS